MKSYSVDELRVGMHLTPVQLYGIYGISVFLLDFDNISEGTVVYIETDPEDTGTSAVIQKYPGRVSVHFIDKVFEDEVCVGG